MRTFLIGSTGMLGSEVVRVFHEAGADIREFSRSGANSFDASKHDFSDFADELALSKGDLLINAIGWIPQKASGDLTRDQRDSFLLNTELPRQISTSSETRGFRWLQIGTDCVFSGLRGSYIESDHKDALDLYGQSKVAGEKYCDSALLIRASIIGPDSRTSAGLYSWFKSNRRAKHLSGFTNHLWNGVTTTAFAKLALGLRSTELAAVKHHWTPSNQVSKYDLLELFRKNLDLASLKIEPTQTEVGIDRTLSTSNPHLNEELWRVAGYDGVPSIELLVHEMIEVDARGEKGV